MEQANFIESHVQNGGIGVLVELSVSNRDATKSEPFTSLAKGLAIHIAAMTPRSVEELLQQPSVMDPGRTVTEMLASVANELGVKVAITRFVRWVANPQESDPPRSPAVALRA